jgi:2-phosphoglycerate kinase
LSTESQWLNYSQEIYSRSIHSVDLTVKSGKALRSEIQKILTKAHNDRILKNNISEISKLLKTSENNQQYSHSLSHEARSKS